MESELIKIILINQVRYDRLLLNIGIKVIKIETDINNLINTHKTYKNKKDVVGVNIRYSRNLNTETIINNKDKEYWKTLKKLIQ